MVAAIALAISASSVQATPPTDTPIDLYLIGGRQEQMQNLDWLKEANPTDPIQSLLAPELKALAQEKTPFLILDGGQSTVFPSTKEFGMVKYLIRDYTGYNSKTESVTTHGVTRTQVLAKTSVEMTGIGGINTKPICPAGYVNQGFVYFGPPDAVYASAALQDPNSYRQAKTGGMAQDQNKLEQSILISRDSIETSKAYLDGLGFKGVCICGWGLSQKNAPNYVAFPPDGVVGHYKIVLHDGVWKIKLVEYLR